MQNVPSFVYWLFGCTALTAVWMFYKTTNKLKIVLVILLAWLALQGVASLKEFYTVTNAKPPRFMLLVLPPVIFIVVLFVTAKGRKFIDGLNIKMLTIFHTIRIPVEIVLLLLYTYHAVPKLLTFEGGNLDILSGLTVPLIYYFAFVNKRLGRYFVIGWNVVCLLFLVNVVSRAVLSTPSPFQHLAFNQPNIAILHFPFVWLPCCVVPLVLFCHLAVLRQLLRGKG